MSVNGEPDTASESSSGGWDYRPSNYNVLGRRVRSVEKGNGVREISTHPVSSTEQTRWRIKVKAEPGERGCERE